MTDARLWRGRSRRLAILLATVTVLPAVTLVWLGVTILRQDRDLAAKHASERQQAQLAGVVRSLDQSLVEAERAIADGPVPPGMVRLVFGADGAHATPANGVLWLPRMLPAIESDSGFLETERIEFDGHEVEALAAYRAALKSSDSATRAGALFRIGRLHRRGHRWPEALDAYRQARAAGVAPAGGGRGGTRRGAR